MACILKYHNLLISPPTPQSSATCSLAKTATSGSGVLRKEIETPSAWDLTLKSVRAQCLKRISWAMIRPIPYPWTSATTLISNIIATWCPALSMMMCTLATALLSWRALSSKEGTLYHILDAWSPRIHTYLQAVEFLQTLSGQGPLLAS